MRFASTVLANVADRTVSIHRPKRTGFVAVGLVVGLVGLALSRHDAVSSQGCRVEPAPPRFGVETNASMRVSHGTLCSISMRPTSSVVDDLAIVQSPANGSLRLRGRTGVIYLPTAGFIGGDSFAFEIRGHAGATPKVAVVRVRVSVE